MIRVLHSVSNMDRGGIETMLMNYYRNIDRTKIQFDFISNKTKPGDYDDEIKSMGGRIFLGPGLKPNNYPEYLKFIDRILTENPDIKILHAHNEGMAFYPLSAAKKAGLKVRIAHAHNTRIIRDYKWSLKIVCKAMIPYAANQYWSCGTDAGIYYFGKKRWEEKGKILHNAISLDSFRFNNIIRDKIRAEYGLKDKFVIGNVGRFNLQKNHLRLIDIFREVVLKNPDARLLLVGEGELELKTKAKASEYGLDDKVLFLGLRSDVNDLYQAMDVFVMPSLFEGLPVVGIEAQASGLDCVYSDKITKEALILADSECVGLKQGNSVWADIILKHNTDVLKREKAFELVCDAGYDIRIEAKKLEEIYLELCEEVK